MTENPTTGATAADRNRSAHLVSLPGEASPEPAAVPRTTTETAFEDACAVARRAQTLMEAADAKVDLLFPAINTLMRVRSATASIRAELTYKHGQPALLTLRWAADDVQYLWDDEDEGRDDTASLGVVITALNECEVPISADDPTQITNWVFQKTGVDWRRLTQR